MLVATNAGAQSWGAGVETAYGRPMEPALELVENRSGHDDYVLGLHRGQLQRKSPGEIADRPLAEGEIDEEEYERIAGRPI